MSGSVAVPPSVKIPQQKRSREKFKAMLRAAEKLFAEQGIPQTSVQQIVEAAGVSIGAFYQRFENKDALIHTIFYLLEDELSPLLAALETSEGQSLEQTIELVTSNSIKFYSKRRGVFLALLLAVQENPQIREYVSQLRTKLTVSFTGALEQYKDEIGSRRFKTAAAMSSRILESYLDQSIIWADHPATEANLKYKASDKELVRVILAYLTHS